MALTGTGAMLLFYDIVPAAVEEHDDWHTHEHFPERVGIPGFLRASRWVICGAGPRYFVVYEVEDVTVLSGAPYLERLNNPTPWTSKMMPNFRGMTRGFCRLSASAGLGLGTALRSIRVPAPQENPGGMRDTIAAALPAIAESRGLASAHLFEPAAQPPMTKEQAIRGKDAEMPWVLAVTGYDDAGVATAARQLEAVVARHGIAGPVAGEYRLHGLLTRRELLGNG